MSQFDQDKIDVQPVVSSSSVATTIAEIALVFAVFFLHGAWPTPDVNETGYVTKAVHFWNHDAFANDFFCNSGDAQVVFFSTLGWLAKFGLSLDTIAWIGRVASWLMLAIAWRRLSFAVLPRAWIAVLTAELFVLLTEQTHMAGEWIIGGVEAKGFAWAFVLWALAAVVRGKWNIAWVLLGAATSFHVVVGGWAAICLGAVWIGSKENRPSLSAMLPALVISGLLALPGIYFAARLHAGADWPTILQADRIQVFERLPHHLLPAGFATGYVPRQLLLWTVFILLCALVPPADGDRRLRRFVRATMAISLVGFAFGWLANWLPDVSAFVLRLYWFRMSDILVPCGVALVGLQYFLIVQAQPSCKPFRCRLLAVLLFVCIYDLCTQTRHQPWLRETKMVNPRSDKFVNYDDWRAVCRWAAENTSPGTVFITPRNSSTFKWYAGRDEVATWKDMPQDAAGVVEWRKRMQTIFAADPPTALKPWRFSLAEAGAEGIQKLAARYGAEYAIVDIMPDIPLPNLEPVYKNDSFVVYQFASP